MTTKINFRAYKKYILVGILVIISIVFLILKISKEESIDKKIGYSVIDCVDGITFEVDKSIADKSTAIMEISENIDFADNLTYMYKNGSDTYMLFNMKQFIVAVKKGTSFALSEGTDGLSHHSMNGIWFTPSGDVTKEKNKCTVDATAQVVITNSIYNDFKGVLTTLEAEDVEWSVFVGYAKGQDNAFSDMTKYVGNTLAYTGENAADIGNYEVDIIDKTFAETELVVEEVEVEVKDETVVEDNTSDGNKDEDDSKFHAQTNQTEFVKEEGKAYTSSIYSMLKEGDTGFAIITNTVGGIEDIYIRLDEHLDTAQTKKLIEQYIKSGNSYYTEMEAPIGTHFEAIRYSVFYKEDAESYVDVRFLGLDGEDMRFRGITYSHMTYDIFEWEELSTDGWIENRICFYAVPNGCKDYVLKCGGGNDDYDAYYYMKAY